MTKSEFIHAVQSDAQAHGIEITKVDTNAVIQSVFDVIGQELAAGNNLPIPGFGTFKVKTRNARKGRNPRTGNPIDIPAAEVVSLKAAPTLKKLVNS